jgi:predicted XRE-type DNA-binding protein
VFADLGLPNPERELLKARLTLEISRLLKERHLTQASAGMLLGIKQPHVSLLGAVRLFEQADLAPSNQRRLSRGVYSGRYRA